MQIYNFFDSTNIFKKYFYYYSTLITPSANEIIPIGKIQQTNYTGWQNITDQLSLRSIVLNILTTGINDCNLQNSLDYFVNTIRIKDYPRVNVHKFPFERFSL